MKNAEIAAMFYEMADLLDILGVEWKPLAFRKAARTLETYPEPIEDLYKKKGEKGLLELDAIGKGMAFKIGQYIDTGKMDEYEELKKEVPKGVNELLKVPGLGPKKAARMYKELKIDSLEKLEKMAQGGKIRSMSGFGEKSEEDILAGLALVKKGTERRLMGIVLPYARGIVKEICKIPGVENAELAGSLRRRRETVKDMDMVVFSKSPGKVSKALTQLSEVESVIKVGEKMTSVRFKNGLQSDMRILSPELRGSGMVHFTGSKEHGIAIRNRAIKMGMKFSEYGLLKGNKVIASKTEEEVYKGLKLSFVPPELRENLGEIEVAEKGKLPRLIPYDAMKGDLHVHTNWDHGANTTEQMVQKAVTLGYEYVALSDHTKSDIIANGLNEKRLKEHWKEIDTVQKKYPSIHILKAIECAILPDGKLDFPDAVLKQLDVVGVSIHSGFKSDEKKMTQRIVCALENEYVHFMGHPTGRLINQRNPYAFNLDEVLDAAKSNGKAMEINSFPSRMDFDPPHIRECLKRGIPLVINTDSHSIENMDFMEFGIGQARRGWVEEKNVMNALPWKKFEQWARRT